MKKINVQDAFFDVVREIRKQRKEQNVQSENHKRSKMMHGSSGRKKDRSGCALF